MMTERHVVAEDLEPAGWCCEGCARPFLPGDLVYGLLISLTYDGTEIEGDYRCGVCWLNGTALIEMLPQCEHVDSTSSRCTLAAGHPVGPMYTFGGVVGGHLYTEGGESG